MRKMAVIMGADTLFGLFLCETMLQKGWHVYGGMIHAGSTITHSLSMQYPEQFITMTINPSSLPSFQQAARLVANQADHVDILISHMDQAVKDDPGAMMSSYDMNALGPIRFVEAFIPLMQEGMKRICFISNKCGMINYAQHDHPFGYSMSKAALHMSVKIMSNHLCRDGFAFEIYMPRSQPDMEQHEWHEQMRKSAVSAVRCFLKEREDGRIVKITDDEGNEWPL